MFFDPKIPISRSLHEKLKKKAEQLGYASTEEFVLHILEKAAEDGNATLTPEEIRQRLKGLGYLG